MEGGVRAAVYYVTSGAETSVCSVSSVSESRVSCTRNYTFPVPGHARARPSPSQALGGALEGSGVSLGELLDGFLDIKTRFISLYKKIFFCGNRKSRFYKNGLVRVLAPELRSGALDRWK